MNWFNSANLFAQFFENKEFTQNNDYFIINAIAGSVARNMGHT